MFIASAPPPSDTHSLYSGLHTFQRFWHLPGASPGPVFHFLPFFSVHSLTHTHTQRERSLPTASKYTSRPVRGWEKKNRTRSTDATHKHTYWRPCCKPSRHKLRWAHKSGFTQLIIILWMISPWHFLKTVHSDTVLYLWTCVWVWKLRFHGKYFFLIFCVFVVVIFLLLKKDYFLPEN